MKAPKFKTSNAASWQEMYGHREGKIVDRQYFCWAIKGNGLVAAYSRCCACGWKRGTVDLAHKCPAKQGGEYTFGNIVPLCPNCHRLFDTFQLSKGAGRRINRFTKMVNIKIKENKKLIK